MMAMYSPAATRASGSRNAFDAGNYATKFVKVEPKIYSCFTDSSDRPPKQLLICTPTDEGVYPVLVFLHGYLFYNSFYSQLLQHIASHGFVAVAPQLYSFAGPDTNNDIKITAEIINWLSENLGNYLPADVEPNMKKLVLAGHSRGGKVAFASALGKSSIPPIKVSALIGVDPVDGLGKGKQSPPPVLTYKSHSFNLDGTPVLVLGSGLGELPRNCLCPPCAPKGVNHEEFYRECSKPAYYFVVKDFGHVDMLDDVTKGIRGLLTYFMCKNGVSRKPMRTFVGGIIVAFLNAYLEDDSSELLAIREGDEMLPVELQNSAWQV